MALRIYKSVITSICNRGILMEVVPVDLLPENDLYENNYYPDYPVNPGNME